MDIQYELFLKLLEVANSNQTELAKRTGKPVERINEWKNGKHLPSLKQLELMADKLGYGLHVELVRKKK